jgi:hypothetical protein
LTQTVPLRRRSTPHQHASSDTRSIPPAVTLLELRLKNGDLLLGAGDPRFVAVELRLFPDDIGLSLLGALHHAVAGAFQIRVALEVLLRIDERCLIRCHLLTSLFDREALQRDLLR